MTVPRSEEAILRRALQLKRDHDESSRSRTRIRAILNGGVAAIQALLGPHVTDEDLPWPNLLLTGLTRIAQKIGGRPNIRVDPPTTTEDDRPRKLAEKRERVVESYDLADRRELQLPQVGRWLPGYGFAVWTVGARLSPEGIPYPHAELRDPYDCYPSAWGVDQQPDELAIWRRIPPAAAKELYPEYAHLIDQKSGRPRSASGGVVLGRGQWENPIGRGLSIVEFYDDAGLHILLPDIEKRVRFTPNPLLSGPSFVVIKRFAFDALIGQYDHSIGLMAAMAKINVLSIMAMKDAVHTETNIIGGDIIGGGQYQKGRAKTNRFPPGTVISKPQSNLPYQLFEQINRIEHQFRIVSGYNVQDDAQSPANLAATGAGLGELKTSMTNEVNEYHKVLRFGLQDIDSKLLEWDEEVSPERSKPLVGVREGVPFREMYRPRTHIKGDYRTRRAYGAMAAWDDSAKIVGGLQLLGANVIDVLTFQENIDGLEHLTEINERIAYKEAATALRDGLVFAANNGDPKAIMSLIEMLPEGDQKETFKKFFTPGEPDLSAEEEQFISGPQGLDALAAAGGLPPDVTTVLGGIEAGGATTAGAQTVARVG